MTRINESRPSVAREALGQEINRQEGKKSDRAAEARGPRSAQVNDGVDAKGQPLTPQTATPAGTAQRAEGALAQGQNPFAQLAQAAAVSLPTRGLAAAGTLDKDLSPKGESVASLGGLEKASLGLGGAKGERVLAATDKVRVGMMLSLSDAAQKSDGKLPKQLVSSLAEAVAKQEKVKGEKLAEVKLANIQSAFNGQRAIIHVGTDVNALVQAVLREAYLMQNEILKDFADKVKFYNKIKKNIREQQKKAREMALSMKPGDSSTEPLWYYSPQLGKWMEFEMPELEIEGAGTTAGVEPDEPGLDGPGAESSPTGGVPLRLTSFTNMNQLAAGQIPSSPTPLPISLGGSFERTQLASATIVGGPDDDGDGVGDYHDWMFNDQLAGGYTLADAIQTGNGAAWDLFARAWEGDASEENAEFIGVVCSQLNTEEFGQLVGGMFEMTAQQPIPIGMIPAIERVVDVTDQGKLWYFVNHQLEPDARESFFTTFPAARTRCEEFEAKLFGLPECFRNDPNLALMATHLSYFQEFGGGGNLAWESSLGQKMKASMWDLPGDSVRSLLEGLTEGGSPWKHMVGELLLSSDPSKVFSPDQNPSDWAFLQDAGGKAARFLFEWLGQEPEGKAQLQTLGVRLAGKGEDTNGPSRFTNAGPSAFALPKDTPQGVLRSASLAGMGSAFSSGEASETTAALSQEPGPAAPDPTIPPQHEASGKSWTYSKENFDEYMKSLDDGLQQVGDDAQLAQTDLQNALQQQQQLIQMMSNISKMVHDTAMSIIRKIGG